ncbi:MAG: NAD-dependent DNA ligase LigA, partial [Dorea sp.]|nr:NAD-dependent DNA ligase LigA [Dorea sp.]
MLQEIETLVQTLNKQRDAYYNRNSPTMTDKEYDRLFDRLTELEKESGIIFSNSPTQSVGYYPVSELKKVRYPRALLSLEKTKKIQELADFMENQDTLLMLKLDGLTVKLVYKEGRLVQASTRGDGDVGEDITHNIPAFENVPLSISYKERLVAVGEAFIYKDVFQQLKDTIRDGNGEPYKNARNLASGSARNLNPEVCKGRHINFIPFNVLEGLDGGEGVDSR